MSKAERTKQFIIESTAPVFNKMGYYGTSMSEITKATNLTKGAVYGNFRDKNELACEAFKYNFDLLKTGVLSYSSRVSNYADKLQAQLEFYKKNVDIILSRGGCAILNGATDSDDTNPDLFAAVATALSGWRRAIVKSVELGISAGEIKPETNAEEFGNTFVSLIEGGILLSKSLNHRSHIDSNIKVLSQMIDNMRT